MLLIKISHHLHCGKYSHSTDKFKTPRHH